MKTALGGIYSASRAARNILSRNMSSSPTACNAPNPIPAVFLRGGTSKGVFINRRHLGDQADWAPIFLRLMGSPDPEHGRQLNGMGGGISSTSKIMVVGPPSPETAARGIDAEYTFAQVGIRDDKIDYSGNCGNLTSMVGVFAVDEGICTPRVDGQLFSAMDHPVGTVRMWNTNTNKEIHTIFPVAPDLSPVLDLPQVSIAGVPGKASQILLDFINPGGAGTDKLLPTGNPIDSATYTDGTKTVSHNFSLVDATNPTVIVASVDLFGSPHLPSPDVYSNADSTALLGRLELIRKAGAIAMGLDPSAQAQPKIAIVGLPADSNASSPLVDDRPVDVDVQALSMGVLHRAVPMTVGLCLGVAASLEGTVVHAIVKESRVRATRVVDSEMLQQDFVRLRHPSGVVDVGAKFASDGNVSSAKVVRTGRRIMQGAVWW